MNRSIDRSTNVEDAVPDRVRRAIERAARSMGRGTLPRRDAVVTSCRQVLSESVLQTAHGALPAPTGSCEQEAPDAQDECNDGQQVEG